MLTSLINDQGFAIVPGVLAQSEINNLLNAVSEIESKGKAGIRHALKNSAIQALADDPRLLKISREILGESAFPFRATLFAKSPDANWLVVWHQDTALPLCQKQESAGWGPWSTKEGIVYAHAPASALQKILALRIHLDDSTESNGPLKVVPGSHNRGVLSDDQIHDLTVANVNVECVVSRGGVLAMRPLLVHVSTKVRDNASRRVLHIEYSACKSFENDLQLAIA
jgi:ectoine hydroxylase-related dioxygenase (phytanoyl-CoA dioxygenase family)